MRLNVARRPKGGCSSSLLLPFALPSFHPMNKSTDPRSEGALLRHCIFDREFSYPINVRQNERDTCEFKEFGMSARAALTNDILIKKVADETVSQGTRADEGVRTIVHLCYNWKLGLPFVVVERAVKNARREYTPQYGRDDNYIKHTWTKTMYKIYTIEEYEKNEPEVALLLNQLE